MVLNNFTLVSKKVIQLFKFIKIFILLALLLIFNMAQAASTWTWITDTPVVGDGNHSVYIDGSGLINDLEDDGWYYLESTLKEYYKAMGSSESIVLNTFNYSGTPSTRSITGREPGEYYYKLTVCTEDETGEEYCPTYTTNTVTVVGQIPEVPNLNNISGSNPSVDYYVNWSSVEQADTYQVAEKVNNGSWVYAKYSISADDTEIVFTDTADGTYSYQVRACNSSGCSTYSSIKTIVVTAPVPETISLPYSESFESSLGEWTNASSKNWSRDAYGTSSGGTGPSTAKDGNYYMYMETSYGSAYYSGNTATLVSPFFNALSASMSFSYHMYGSNMGTLYLDVYSNGSWHNNVWSKSGQQHSSNSATWATATISLAAYSGVLQIRFRGVAAGGYRGDMAIDNVHISSVTQARRKVTFIHTDLLGSPVAETDENGTLQGGQ